MITVAQTRQLLSDIAIPFTDTPEIASNHRGVQTLVYFSVDNSQVADYAVRRLEQIRISAFRNSSTEHTIAAWASDVAEYLATPEGR